MKRALLLVVVFALMVTPFAMVSAQDPEGGVIIEGNGGTSVGAMNPLRCSGVDCSRINALLFPGLINVDPATANYAPGAPGGLATDWTLSEDGLTYTFTLRDDFFWTDGERVDAWDWAFAFEAANSDLIESALIGYTQEIASYEVLDDGLTLKVTFHNAACTNLSNIAFVTPIPAHHFGWTPENAADFDYAALVGHDYDTNPEPSAGTFKWESMQAGERIALVPNEEYVDATDGEVKPGGFLYINVPDQVVMAERFIAGELNVMEGPQNQVRQQIRDTESLQYFDFAGNSWDYVGLNYADPDHPQSAQIDEETGEWTGSYVDAEGNVAETQDAHPIFSDVRVRRALQMGINLDEIMEKAVLGEGTPMAANQLPTAWAVHPDLQPIPYDPEGAAALLAEAGWADSDGDGILDKDGVKFEFELLTNEGNARRGQIGELLQDQWGALGVQVNFSAIDFNALLEIMDNQTFDAFVLGWRNGFPDDPDQTTLFTTANDIVASGQNTTSYSNPEIDRLMLEGKTVPGCAPADRAPIYHQIQEIIQADQPYLWLFAQNGMYAANDAVQGFAPYPSQLYWNVDSWTVTN